MSENAHGSAVAERATSEDSASSVLMPANAQFDTRLAASQLKQFPATVAPLISPDREGGDHVIPHLASLIVGDVACTEDQAVNSL